ncbi:unnamed protein product [Arctogadus glacialis]
MGGEVEGECQCFERQEVKQREEAAPTALQPRPRLLVFLENVPVRRGGGFGAIRQLFEKGSRKDQIPRAFRRRGHVGLGFWRRLPAGNGALRASGGDLQDTGGEDGAVMGD